MQSSSNSAAGASEARTRHTYSLLRSTCTLKEHSREWHCPWQTRAVPGRRVQGTNQLCCASDAENGTVVCTQETYNITAC